MKFTVKIFIAIILFISWGADLNAQLLKLSKEQLIALNPQVGRGAFSRWATQGSPRIW